MVERFKGFLPPERLQEVIACTPENITNEDFIRALRVRSTPPQNEANQEPRGAGLRINRKPHPIYEKSRKP